MRRLGLLLILLFSVLNISALSLSDNASIDIVIISTMAENPNPVNKQLALSNIGQLFDEGRITDGDTDIAEILGYLSRDGLDTVADGAAMSILTNNLPAIRRRACQLLGRLGGDIAVSNLMQVLRIETHNEVVIEAIFQLGQIGLNPDEQVSELILDLLQTQYYQGISDSVAFVALECLMSLALGPDGLSNIRPYQMMMQISQDAVYNATVRSKALEALQRLQVL